MSSSPRRPRIVEWSLLIGLVGTGLSIAALEWDLSALANAKERGLALARLQSFFGGFGAPDFSSDTLARAGQLALKTFAISCIGMCLGVALAYPLALGAAKSVVLDLEETLPGANRQIRRRLKLVVVELFRLVLDVLRGVPDFVWAILFVIVVDTGPVAGVLAIGLNAAGIIGKVFSEMWDSVEPRRYESVRAAGASRLKTLWYGIQPLSVRGMISYTLMRGECAVRNASVIGVVGGGGLGTELWDEFNFGNYSTTVTFLLALLALTAAVDLLANLLRYQLRAERGRAKTAANRGALSAVAPRIGAGVALVATVGFCIAILAPEFARLGERPTEWSFLVEEYAPLFTPDVSAEALGRAAVKSTVPLALAFLGTLAALFLALGLSYPGSLLFQLSVRRLSGERPRLWVRVGRFVGWFVARVLALGFRAIPEVAWILMIGACFRLGTVAGLGALVLHSSGVLARVFTEAIDNVPTGQLERQYRGSRSQTFFYSAIPHAWSTWMTYGFFQFESNVRMGITLGVIGVGGIGDAFHTCFSVTYDYPRAATYLLAMIGLTVVIDRFSRALKITRTF
ncbi:MAG: PhnE/PtxC family ABC transporter permease [Planctomycetota bacterium]